METDAAPTLREATRPAVCAGDPRAIGVAQGEAWRAAIRSAPSVLDRLEAFRMRQPPWVPYPIFRGLAEWRAQRVWRCAVAPVSPAGDERLRGIAESSGLSPRTLALLTMMEPFMADVRDLTLAAPPGGCSAVAVRGTRAADGEPVIARNFDYLPLVQPLYRIRDSRPRGRHRSLDFTVAPIPGALDGINDAGLCVTYDYAFAVDAAKPGPPISVVLSEVLATASDVASAIDLLSVADRWGAGLLMLADASGDIASVELTSTRIAVRRPAPGVDLLHHSNRFCEPTTREVEVPENVVFSDRAPEALRGRRMHESSSSRDTRYAELLADSGPLDLDDLERILADHGPLGAPSELSPCVHSDYWTTTATMQLLPRSRRLRVSFSSACEASFTELAL